jgi:hypothetical protein
MHILCRTTFDITETGITGHFKPSQIPFNDRAGTKITDQLIWSRSRNQQRNFETVSQVLQLRTQIFDVSKPTEHNGYWSFEFAVEFDGVYQQNRDTFGILKQDCDGVPMLTGLDEKYPLASVLTTDGSQQNIWFELIAVNTQS